MRDILHILLPWRPIVFRRAIFAAVLAVAVSAYGPASMLAHGQVTGGTPYAPAPDPVMERMQSRIEALEADLQRATGRSEQLAFDLSQARKLVDDANQARARVEQTLQQLTVRLETLERMIVGETVVGAGPNAAFGAGGPTTQGSMISGQPSPGGDASGMGSPAPGGDPALQSKTDPVQLPGDETELLKQTRQLMLNGEFASARTAAQTYLQRFPKGEYASEAQYLLGESYLYQEAYPEAAEAYGKLLSAYPKAAKGPEGLVKLARAMRLMGQKDQACKALDLMAKQFPKASQAARTLADAEKARASCKS